jgi:hypothetical protein
MTSLTLEVPKEIEETARQLAQATDVPVENVLLDRLKAAFALPLLPADEEAELAALQHLSDDALWTIAREQLPADTVQTMDLLMEKMSRRIATPEEVNQQAEYVERSERLMVRKSEAAAILTRRGYHVTPQDMNPLG